MNISNLIKKYGPQFIIGGCIVAGIKYASENLPTEYAGIVGSTPTGLLLSIFLIQNSKSPAFIKGYGIQSAFLVIVSLLYLLVFNLVKGNNMVQPNVIAYIVCISAFFILTFMKLKTNLISF